MADTERNKSIAMDFLKLVVAGKIDEAYDKYVDMNGKHHNVYFPAGFQALKDAMKKVDKQAPGKVFDTKNALAENDLVATHSYLEFGNKQMTVVHLFRFEKGKIIEMWDLGQEIPENCPNQDGAF